MKRIILITGASGFVGGRLYQRFVREGDEVRALIRDPRTWAKGKAFRFSLLSPLEEGAFEGPVDALIHCAYESGVQNPKEAARTNVEGARSLFEFARRRGVRRIVFVSSLAATEEAESFYGRSKLEIEKMLDPRADLAVRPGLIVGDGGLFQRLRTSIRRTRFVPLFYGGEQEIQTVWIGDLCRAVWEAMSRGIVGLARVAERDPVPIRDFYDGIASLEGKRPLFLKLPGGATLALLRFLERLGFRLPVTSENLLGLKHMTGGDTRDELRKIGAEVRSFHESLRCLRNGESE